MNNGLCCFSECTSAPLPLLYCYVHPCFLLARCIAVILLSLILSDHICFCSSVPQYLSVVRTLIVNIVIGRDGSSDDPCDKPGNGHVLGHVPLELHGDYGGFESTVNCLTHSNKAFLFSVR